MLEIVILSLFILVFGVFPSIWYLRRKEKKIDDNQKKIIWDIYLFKDGLWFSIPIYLISAIVFYQDMQALVILTVIPVVLGLPWNIPALSIALAPNSDLVSWLCIFWIFIATTINCGYIYRKYISKSKKDV